MKKSLLALAVSLAAVSSAHAAWDSGAMTNGLQGNGVGDGEALLYIYDATTQNSYVQDLNITLSALKTTAFNGQTVALDATKISTAFSGNYNNLQWGVIAFGGWYINSEGTALQTSTYGYALTTPTSFPAADPDGNAGLIGNVGQLVGGFQGNQYAGLASSNAVVALGGANAYAGQGAWAGQLDGLFGQNTTGNGGTLNLWYQGYFDNDQQQVRSESLGSLTLNLAGNGLTLNSSAPAVPVPAAAWLMGSALVGLGGVARKRKNRV